MARSNTAAISVTILLAAGLFGCGEAGMQAMRPAELRRALEDAPGIEVRLAFAAAEPREHEPTLLDSRVAAAARALAERTGKEVTVLSGDEPGRAELPRIVLGPPTDPLVRRLAEAAGAELTKGRLTIERLFLNTDRDLLQLTFEDPDRPGLPLNLYVAREPRALLLAIEDLTPATRAGLRFFSTRRRVVELGARSGGRWVATRSSAPGLPGLLKRPRTIDRQPAFTVELLGGVDPERAREYAARATSTLAALSGWLGEAELGYRQLLLVDSVALQRENAGASDPAVLGPLAPRVWVLLVPGMHDDAGAAAARDAVRSALGDPARSWMLDGAAYDAADRWWGRPLAAWGQRLAHQELLPPLAELLDTAAIDRHSRHVLAPARALFFRYLRETRGADELRALWRGEAELELGAELESRFREWLRPAGAVALDCTAEAHAARLAALAEVTLQRGVALDSNALAGGGYDDPRELLLSLRGAVREGANAVSLTSFFSERRPAPRFPGGQLPEGRESLEGDVALAQVAAVARRAGVEVLLLQPHLLLSDSAGYSAWLRRTGIDHWQEFFDAFEPMVVHYGLLAELCGVQLISLGTGIARSPTSSGLPPAVHVFRDEQWTASIELARRAFGGALTYTAGSVVELREYSHWEELDYVGLSMFPRFSPLTGPPHTDRILQYRWARQLKQLGEVAERVGRPALIVEVGVRSTSRAATESEIGPGFAEEAEQARALRALRSALQEKRDAPLPLAGLYFWKWNASSSAGGPTDRGFSIQHKSASVELSRLRPPE